MAVFALVDGNNFYASCERVFDPKLRNLPIVILSNNDGCVIARSNEAKAYGIKMGAPYHEMKALIQQHGVKAFSSNYTLYGEMSARMMNTLATFSPHVEIYSIDECFIDLDGFLHFDLERYGHAIRQTVKQNVGIPCSVGIANTKTLAKIANKYAKTHIECQGVVLIADDFVRVDILKNTPVDDIWGIGRQYQTKLKLFNIHNAYELSLMPLEWAAVNLGGVVGKRLVQELNGISCIKLEEVAETKKNIAATRAFGKVVTEQQDISEALSFHIARAAEKLRAQSSVAKLVSFFFHSNPFSKVYPYFTVNKSYELPVATSDTRKLNDPIQAMLKKTFKPGIRYHKCGVMLHELQPADQQQQDLFAISDSEVSKSLFKTIDQLNVRFGKNTMAFASDGFKKNWMTQANFKSPRYTTNWLELMVVKS